MRKYKKMTDIKILPKKYDAKTSESFWQNYWKENKVFSWKNDLPKDQTFVIDTPPPTVSGLLHMGHVFSYCQADFVARFQRMNGKDVFYPMGFDDNGLPTERLVEKIIKKKAGIYEHENGHGSFVNKCREVVDEAEKEFEALFNSIALSVDWDQKYQTISPQSQKISQASFLDLHKKGLVEKNLEPVFWDISDRTALSQADLIDKEVEGVMNEVEFSIENSDEKLVIMTTRPELLPACVSVMVHPEDERYKKFHGKNAITPLFGAKVKIIPDDLVQLDKGTGAVMCCTFGDETDIRWWKKHNLSLNVIIQKDGKIDGLPLKQYKAKIIADLQEKNLLLKQETIKRPVKCAERSGVPIEILVVPQWFIKILDKKAELKEKAAECGWYPEYMKVRIDQWIDGLQWNWCISRQRFFGVAFPVWYSKREGEEGKVLTADFDQLPCDPAVDLPKGYSREEVTPETDIMDTWATSSVSPQLSSHGINGETDLGNQERHNKLFPADLRPQAHEIIRTWAFYTLTKAVLHQNTIPWKNLMISGWCLASDKTKMSKSKGNVVTPTALIEEKSSDIVRYWASTSHLGADTAYSEDVFKIGKKLVTKIFNAAKFASMNFVILDEKTNEQSITQAADLWILSRLQKTVKQATEDFEKFEYARAREAIEDFFWKDFCDNYLEICKVRSYGLEAEKLAEMDLTDEQKAEVLAGQQSAILTLKICLNTLLKLLTPFVPHICDEIYATIFAEEFSKTGSINSRGTWPKVNENLLNEEILEPGQGMLDVIFEARKFKSDNNLSMKTTVSKIIIPNIFGIEPFLADLENVCNAKEVEVKENENNSDFIDIQVIL